MGIHHVNLYPASPERVCGNTLYVNLYSGQQIIQFFQVRVQKRTLSTIIIFIQLYPIPRPIREGWKFKDRPLDTQEYFRVKRDLNSAGWQVRYLILR